MTKVSIRKILVVFLAVVVVSALMPFQLAMAAGTSSLTVTVVTDTNVVVQGATVHVTGPSQYSTDRPLPPTPPGLTTNCLEGGQYEVYVSLPAGYELQSIQVGSGTPDTSVDNRSSAVFQLDPDESLEVSFVCTQSSEGGFTSADAKDNYIFTTASADGNMTVEAAKDLRAGPFDIVIVLDYSGSMAWDFEGKYLPMEGHNRDEYDYIAKNHPDSRYAAMENAVKRFLGNLQDTSEGTVSFVFFSDDARTSTYNSELFHDIASLDIDDFIETEMRENQKVGGSTFTDLAFESVRRILGQADDPGSERERKVVFFTDGEPGHSGFGHYDNSPTWDRGDYDNVSRSTYHSPYRVAAETYNQAGIIKGIYGQSTTVNYTMTAQAPTFGVFQQHPTVPSLVVPFPAILTNDDYVYYGAGIDPNAIGYSDSSFPSTNSFSNLTTAYNTAAGNGTLSTLWEQSSDNWYRTTDSGIPGVLIPPLHEYLYWDLQYDSNPNNLTPQGSNAQDDSHYVVLGADPSPANFASSKHGNYERTADGLGAKVYSIGIIDDSTYGGTEPNKVKRRNTIINFLKTVASPDSFYEASDTASLDEAFKTIFHEIVGEYPGVYLGFELDSDWIVFASDGTPVGSDESAGIWRSGDRLYVGPFTASSENLYSLDMILYSRTILDYVGVFSKDDPSSSAMMARTAVYQKTGTNVFSPLDPTEAWVKTVTIAER